VQNVAFKWTWTIQIQPTTSTLTIVFHLFWERTSWDKWHSFLRAGHAA